MQDKIAACALSHYESVLPLKGKPKDTEWTVYAAIVAVEKQQQGEERFWVVSCATGTKCASFVPPKDETDTHETAFPVETTILRDCHAETLARRGLIKVLWSEIASHSQVPSKNHLLEKIPKTDTQDQHAQFQLRSNISLHYYISDPPCGDASIFPLNDVTATVKKSKTNDKDNSDLSFTGAKVIVNKLNGVQAHDCGGDHQLLSSGDTATNNQATATVAREDIQLLGKLRTKSGRSNLPDHMRSSCMSCSDKLVRWCVLGMQGSVLSRFIPSSLRIQSIVVSLDLRAKSKLAQEEALDRKSTNPNWHKKKHCREQPVIALSRHWTT